VHGDRARIHGRKWPQSLPAASVEQALAQGVAHQFRGVARAEFVEHAAAMGANAVVAMRYDANDVAAGVTEVLAYGTAVVIEPIRS